MIDFHNHILPGVDDGPATIKESIEMLHCAQDQGITDVVNTTHFQHPKMEGKRTDFDFISGVRDQLVQEMKKEDIEVNIHLGMEVFFNFNLLDILDNPLTTIGNGKYMLIEFQTLMFPENFENELYNLKISGITPIIAHPERYRPIQNDINILERLIESGCLIQIDAGSLLGQFGNRCKISVESILRKNMAHLIGSDSHGIGKRNFCLSNAKKIAEKLNIDNIDSMVYENPLKIIKGEKIIPSEIKKDSKHKSFFYKFFNK